MARGSHHIIPVRTLAIVIGVLVALTVVTVVTAQFDLGALNVPLALAIAGTKALVVAAIFMGLKYDNPVNFVVITLGVIFAVVFLTITLSDTAFRGALDIQPRGYIPYEVEDTHTGDEHATESEVVDTTAVAAPAPARAAVALYEQYCITCHSLDGSALAGPTFEGLGALRSRDEIAESIRDPDATLTEGFPGLVMVATLNAFQFYEGLTDEEFESLVDFVQAQ